MANALSVGLVVVLSGALTVAMAPAAFAPTAVEYLVTNSTHGYYNHALGTVLDETQMQFPCRDILCGDPVINPALEPDLTPASGVLSEWLAAGYLDDNPTTLNAHWSGPEVIPSSWPVNTENAIIYAIDGGTTGLTSVMARFGVDNGIFVWLNGVYKFGATEPYGAPLGEYVVSLGDLPPGLNYLQILREDHGGLTGYNVEITGARNEVANRAPDCAGVWADPNEMWEPNHRMVEVTIGGATDPDGDGVTMAITGVTQDEPVAGPGFGKSPDAVLSAASNRSVELRVERDGDGDGRVYRIAFTADDGLGGSCAGTALVAVPHDQGGDPAVDSGGSFDATAA